MTVGIFHLFLTPATLPILYVYGHTGTAITGMLIEVDDAKSRNRRESQSIVVLISMARANLHVTDQLRDAFSNAAGTGTRWLSVAIEGETLVHSGTGNQAGENLEQDFDTIVAAIAQNESTPALFIVRNDADKWHVMLYNPEGAPVRDKMLYAAACEDTKLALSLAENAFNATCLEDVEFAAFNAMFNRSNAQPLSEAEVLAFVRVAPVDSVAELDEEGPVGRVAVTSE